MNTNNKNKEILKNYTKKVGKNLTKYILVVGFTYFLARAISIFLGLNTRWF